MFNKKYIRGIAAAIGTVVIAASCLFINTAKADTQPADAGTASTEIRTVQELVEAAKNPEGNYKLMADLDMSGVEWTPWDFSGTFEGNGHSILNRTFFGLPDLTNSEGLH